MILLTGLIAGCKTAGKFEGTETYYDREGKPIYERSSLTNGEADPGKNPGGDTTLNVGHDGVHITTPRAKDKTQAEIDAESLSVYHYAAIACFAAAVICVIIRQYMAAACAGVAGAVLMFVPSIITGIEPIIPYVAGGLIVAGGAWAISRWKAVDVEKRATVTRALEANAEGKPDAAMAIIETLPTPRAIKKKMTQTGKLPAATQ